MILDDTYCPPPPDEAPTSIESFAVVVQPPGWGWLHFKIIVDGVARTYSASYVFFGIERFKAWHEAIAVGRDSCISVDSEGWHFLMHARCEPDSEEVRFTLLESWAEGIPTLIWRSALRYSLNGVEKVEDITLHKRYDIVLPRRVLLSTFYHAFLEIWEKPTPEAFWNKWDNTTAEQFEEDTGKPYGTWHVSMKSPVIDAYLAR